MDGLFLPHSRMDHAAGLCQPDMDFIYFDGVFGFFPATAGLYADH